MNNALTERIVQARAEGLTNKEIAKKLRISDWTVKKHLIQALKQKRRADPGEDDSPPSPGSLSPL